MSREALHRLTRFAEQVYPLVTTNGPSTSGHRQGSTFYQVISPERVDPSVTLTVARMSEAVRRDLGLERVLVAFTREVSAAVAGGYKLFGVRATVLHRDRAVYGSFSHPGVVLISTDHYPYEIAETTAHELRHQWQYQYNKNLDPVECERDAERYARDAMRRHWPTVCRELKQRGLL